MLAAVRGELGRAREIWGGVSTHPVLAEGASCAARRGRDDDAQGRRSECCGKGDIRNAAGADDLATFAAVLGEFDVASDGRDEARTQRSLFLGSTSTSSWGWCRKFRIPPAVRCFAGTVSARRRFERIGGFSPGAGTAGNAVRPCAGERREDGDG